MGVLHGGSGVFDYFSLIRVSKCRINNQKEIDSIDTVDPRIS